MANFLNKDLTTKHDLLLGMLVYSPVINWPFRIEEVSINSNIPISEIVTVKRISGQGPEYDVIIDKKTLDNEIKYIYRPGNDVMFNKTDRIGIECTNANALGVVYCALKISTL